MDPKVGAEEVTIAFSSVVLVDCCIWHSGNSELFFDVGWFVLEVELVLLRHVQLLAVRCSLSALVTLTYSGVASQSSTVRVISLSIPVENMLTGLALAFMFDLYIWAVEPVDSLLGLVDKLLSAILTFRERPDREGGGGGE
ncbi:hypothetical protein Tco_0439191 [Tanacetum coccineum]